MHKLLLTFGVLIFGLQWGIAGNECGVLEDIEAVDDFGETYRGIILKINVLDNDKGDNIKLVEISDYPKGIILNREENGWIEYVLNPSTPLNSKDSLEYVIEDSDGKKDSAQVFINFLEDTPLYGQIYLDCTTLFDCYNCKYLEVNILTGIYPPFEITYLTENYSVSKVLLEGESLFEPVCISEWEKYEVFISDSEGNVFYYTSEFWCSHLPYCYPNWKPYELQCNGDGTTTVQFEADEVIEEAYWTAPDGHRQALKDGDIVLDRSYLQFFQMCGGQSDTLVNCFGASDDYLVVGLGRSRLLNIMENDFGKNIEVSEILTLPVCGEFQAWDLENYIYYSSEENVNCEEDSLNYVLTNEFGQKDTATVWIEVEQEPTLILNWEVECHTEVLGLLSVTIENGAPPYSVFGLFNDDIVENYFSMFIPQNVNAFVEVIDADSNSAKFEPTYWGQCIGECYELADKSYWGTYTIECNGDETANIEGSIVNNAEGFSTRKSFWIESDGTYHPLDFAEIGNIAFPNHSYFYVETKQSGHIDGFINCRTSDIEAVDDFGSTFPGEDAIINVLANDQGDGLRITQIIELPQCGEILEWSEYGEVVYLADVDTECTVDKFVYEVEDNWGEKDTAVATIFIEHFPLLIVEAERDCSGAYETGNYSWDIFVYGEMPPFLIDINGQEDTLYESGMISYEFLETGTAQSYELSVRDSTGQEFYEMFTVNPCVYLNWFCEEGGDYKPSITCLGGGDVRVEILESLVEDAHWVDFEGVEHPLKQADTIPDFSFLSIPLLDGIGFDTLINCLSANDDFVDISMGEIAFFNVFENDFGQEIQVSDIVEMPQCGELLEWSANGEMLYRANENKECFKDSLVYEVVNDLGEKTTAKVEFGEDLNGSMYLEWELLECDDSVCQIEITIEEGTPPYTIMGNYNDVMEDNVFGLIIFCGENFKIEVTDSNGQTTFLGWNSSFECFGYDDCYQPRFIHQYLEIECLGEFGGVVHFLERMNISSLDRVFYINSQNQYHELRNQDTIPNNSYYYLELKHLGHIDGFVNCLTTSIEEETEILSNSFLQLYPNPNKGQFSLQIQTPKPSLQYYPIQVYNTKGQLIWKGTVQNNRLETLDLGNVGSGLYVLQMVMEDEVLVERFWVE
ncbi:MAG: T9SS type A sorting domain-containing protein [Chitinophagales bacterium]